MNVYNELNDVFRYTALDLEKLEFVEEKISAFQFSEFNSYVTAFFNDNYLNETVSLWFYFKKEKVKIDISIPTKKLTLGMNIRLSMIQERIHHHLIMYFKTLPKIRIKLLSNTYEISYFNTFISLNEQPSFFETMKASFSKMSSFPHIMGIILLVLSFFTSFLFFHKHSFFSGVICIFSLSFLLGYLYLVIRSFQCSFTDYELIKKLYPKKRT